MTGGLAMFMDASLQQHHRHPIATVAPRALKGPQPTRRTRLSTATPIATSFVIQQQAQQSRMQTHTCTTHARTSRCRHTYAHTNTVDVFGCAGTYLAVEWCRHRERCCRTSLLQDPLAPPSLFRAPYYTVKSQGRSRILSELGATSGAFSTGSGCESVREMGRTPFVDDWWEGREVERAGGRGAHLWTPAIM